MPRMKHLPIDVQIGAHIRERRIIIGMTLSDLAHLLDVSYQQVQKYETGANRVSAATLTIIARHLRSDMAHLLNLDCEASQSSEHRLLMEIGKTMRLLPRRELGLVLAMAKALMPPVIDG